MSQRAVSRWKHGTKRIAEWTFEGGPEALVGADGDRNRYLAAYMLVYDREGQRPIWVVPRICSDRFVPDAGNCVWDFFCFSILSPPVSAPCTARRLPEKRDLWLHFYIAIDIFQKWRKQFMKNKLFAALALGAAVCSLAGCSPAAKPGAPSETGTIARDEIGRASCRERVCQYV